MCTVSFIPTADSYFITSNRDESPGRGSSGLISSHSHDKPHVYFPLDEISGGSWIALADTGRVVCLLNGAYESFIPNPPYQLSRGQVVLEAVQTNELTNFIEAYNLEDIAPFTLLAFEGSGFYELVWDGNKRYIRSLSKETPQIWSSATLYPEEVRKKRKLLFEVWIDQQEMYGREEILQFHQLANGDPENDFIMNRNDIVRTLSITSIALERNKSSILHLALDKNTREEITVRYE